jgi:TIR domain-containing protein/3-keto-disaccharide hydrolase
MPHEVVISHSIDGKATANAICNELESVGIRCWILPRDLNIGVPLDQSISKAVASCRIMIVVFTEYASRSDRIERQVESAFNSGVTIIPFRAEPAAIGNLSESPLNSVHWLDALTPEMRTRLRSLGDLVRSLLSRKRNDAPVPNTSTIAERIGRKARQTSKTGAVKALLLAVTPFLLVLGVGFWRTKNDLKSGLLKQKGAITTPAGKKAADRGETEYVEYAAWDPGWGTPDANWSVTAGKLRITPSLNSSTLLINQSRGFKDAEIAVNVAMTKGENMGQLGGLIFWAKDYNDCYAIVVSADGRFAVGHKLVGRWINPITKTENNAVKTGIGQVNKLRIRTQGKLLTAYVNDTQVATLVGDPPRGPGHIGLYGESAETSQNVWDFTNVTVTGVR